ncbi:Putative Holin-X, holin superfamily III [Pedobacter westerhofensis]|uniref:Holin-X, holin superfamily III n=1 Tax=Pedobacter westerhofensis TaxID=425512 RepID=A0A521DYU6_9SPHI|nr:phage holin family protein [Pedobacter westerhofensis]SMO76241.1 Putative Holin-X, holin superfamily III [Pedobacter westerhofensis]
MEEKKEKDFQDILAEAKTYLDTRVEYTRLFLVKRGSKLFADMITTAIVAVCFTLAFILGSITLALFLSSIFGSYTAGFGSVALIYLILAIIVFVTKDNFIEKAIVNFIIRKYFKKLEEDEDDEQKV